MNRENLIKLANYLLLPKLEADFNMAYFSEESYVGRQQETCGTAGCAVGHGPYAGIPKDIGETWLGYSFRVFGIRYESPDDDDYSEETENAWNWLFSSEWDGVDNTPEGAARRIAYLLNHGEPPGGYNQYTMCEDGDDLVPLYANEVVPAH